MVTCDTQLLAKIKKGGVVVFIMAIVVLCILSFIPDSPVGAFLLNIFYKLMDMNFWVCTVLVFIINVVCVVLMIPSTPVTIFSGIRFGTWIGLCVSQLGCFVGCLIVYGITRFFLFDLVDRYIQKNKLMRSIQKIVEKHGILFITLLRASPLFPFPVINYILPPVVTFFPYAIGSFIGLVPANFFVVYISASITDIAEAFTTNTFQASSTATMIIIIVLTVSLIVIVSLYIKRELKKMEKEEQEMMDEEGKLGDGNNADENGDHNDVITIDALDQTHDNVEIIKKTLTEEEHVPEDDDHDNDDDEDHNKKEEEKEHEHVEFTIRSSIPKNDDYNDYHYTNQYNDYGMKSTMDVIVNDDYDDDIIQVNNDDDDDTLLIDPNA